MAPKRKKSTVEGEEEPELKTPKKSPQKRDKNLPLPRGPTPRGPAPADGARVLKLLTLNVAGLRAVLNGDKAQTLRALIEREVPDVLCLNEHKLKEADVEECEAKLKDLLPKEYASMHWTCSTAKKGYSGVAILLRHATDGGSGVIAEPAKVVATKGMAELAKGDPIIEDEGRLLTLELPEFSIVSVYVPNSGMTLERLAYRTEGGVGKCWDRTLARYVRDLRERRGLPVVMIGDLNCCHRVQDIWNCTDRPDYPEGLAAKPLADQYVGLSALKKAAGLTAEERASFGKMLEEADLVDTFRALHPEASGVFSYFSQRIVQNRPLNHGLRLDYVLATSDMCSSLKPRAIKAKDGAHAGENAKPQAPKEAGDQITEESSKATSGATAGGDAKPPEPKDVGDQIIQETSNAGQAAKTGEAKLPQMLESFILDEGELVADHAPVGCYILLPPARDAVAGGEGSEPKGDAAGLAGDAPGDAT